MWQLLINKGRTVGLKILLPLLLLVTGITEASASPPVQSEIQNLLQEEGLTGMVWSLVTPTGVSTGAAGLANAGTGNAMTPDSRVHIGSVSKTVLATGILRMITEGQLALETPVSTLLPELRLDNPWAASDPVRVGHLLNHTAGLDNLRFWQAFSMEPEPDTPLAEAFTRDATVLRIRTRPGSTYSYSNMGYGLLGMVIESITAQSYEAYLDVNLLQPLSMHNSTFEFVSQTGVSPDNRLAMGHFENDRTQTAVPTFLRPAGQFTTTAGDMAVLAKFLMSDGRVNGREFISPALLGALGQAQGTEAARAGLPMGHGLALAMRDRHGVVGMCHPGTTVGFRAMLCLYPDQGKAFFMATNTDSETADYNRINALLSKALDVAPVERRAVPDLTPQDMEEWQGYYILAPNNMEQFAWVDKVFNFARLSWDGSRLKLKPFQSSERELLPSGGMLFQASDRTVNSHVLFESVSGDRIISDGLHHYRKVPLATLLPHWISVVAGLTGLGWIVLTGLGRLLTGRLKIFEIVALPLTAVCALLLPLPFFYLQSFLQLGDLTVASVLLALVTGFLPLAMVFGVARYFRTRPGDFFGRFDALACFAVFQWTLLLMAVGLLPVRLWN
jgi:CubicO group peptidase (beta-lactamase class C family)